MNEDPDRRITYIPTDREPDRPPPGQSTLVGMGLAIGILLLGLQLWLLTLAFDLFLSDEPGEIAVLAGFSALAFVGGLLMLRLINRKPRRRP